METYLMHYEGTFWLLTTEKGKEEIKSVRLIHMNNLPDQEEVEQHFKSTISQNTSVKGCTVVRLKDILSKV